MTPPDPRLATAVAASRSWYDDVMALHGVAVTVTDGIWVADGRVPPFHSTVLALRPAVDADAAAGAIRARQRGGLQVGGAHRDHGCPETSGRRRRSKASRSASFSHLRFDP